MTLPRISIITVTRNAVGVLANCLASVAEQSGVEVEHVIIDGGSTDGTVDLLRSWIRYPIAWISEPDRGISHAFDKGLERVSGELIGILNADDCYTKGALFRAAEKLAENPQVGFCFGHCLHHEHDGRTWLNRGNPDYFRRMRYFMPDVNHPTMIIRRSAYQRIGVYDEQWRYAMDYDWLCRAEALGVRGLLIDEIQAEMAMGGCSDRYWRRAYREARDIAIRHGAPTVTAHLDHLGRLAKGSIRRSLVALGARDLERQIRHLRQRRALKSK